MLFGETILVALGALRANKLRSLLTMLGIVIGVAAVIAVVALGHGAQKAVNDRISALGTTLLTVSPGQAFGQGGVRTGFGSARLTLEDAKALEANGTKILAVQPEMSGNLQVQYLNKNTNTQIVGVTSNFPEVRKYELAAGRFFTTAEDKGRQLDQASLSFWVEHDPPEKGLFDKIQAEEYPEEMEDLAGYARASDAGGNTFTYNVAHPAYEAVSDDEDDLADYLVGLMALEVARLDLLTPSPKLFEVEDLESPDRVVQRATQVCGRILREYFTA